MTETQDKPTLREAATAWMKDNPGAMALLRSFAQDRLRLKRRFSIQQLIERVRWDYPVAINGADGLKINNNHTAYIARQLIAEDDRLEDLIDCRITKAADRPARSPRIDPPDHGPFEGVL